MMTAAEFIHVELKRLHTMLDGTLSGITVEQLHAVPAGHTKANTLAWALFHCTRTEDNVVRFVLQNRRPTVWTEGGYAERLGLPPVAQGTGMSAADGARAAAMITPMMITGIPTINPSISRARNRWPMVASLKLPAR